MAAIFVPISRSARLIMLSLRNSFDKLDEQDRMLRRALDCYRGALSAIEQHAIDACPPIAVEHRARIRELARMVESGLDVSLFEESRELLVQRLKDFAREAGSFYSEKETAIKDILSLLATATGSVRTCNDVYGARFSTLGNELEALTQVDDVLLIRQRLTVSAVVLRECVLGMQRDSTLAIEALEYQVNFFKEQLAEAEAIAYSDSMTQLPNRREAERQIDTRIEYRRPVCLILFDVDEFKSINDRFGRESGDQVLRAFANALREQMRSADLAVRWGGDEFLVMLDPDIRDPVARAMQIAHNVSFRFPMLFNNRKIEISIHASAGVAEHHSGETSADLFRRIDKSLYAAKPKRAVENAPV
jgi:diguanylate cyclase (GGDEF)-like protein